MKLHRVSTFLFRAHEIHFIQSVFSDLFIYFLDFVFYDLIPIYQKQCLIKLIKLLQLNQSFKM